jgi:DNA-binding protein HU-beta
MILQGIHDVVSPAQAEAAYEGLFTTPAKALKQGDAVSVAGFGSFKVVERKARTGRNPRTGEELAIPASKAVKFTPAKALKESLQVGPAHRA